MPSRIDAFAPAKVNLFLHVGDKRADGFHELHSLAVFADVGDNLAFEESDALTLAIDGPFAAGLAAENDNLVLRAARALAAQAGVAPKAAIRLTKNLPIASGIGGGSADAAAALRGLVQLWDLDTNMRDLLDICEALGSDVPVCLECRPTWMEGRGEQLSWARRIPQMAMVLVNPGAALSTAAVFGGLMTRRGIVELDLDLLRPDPWSVGEFLRSTTNDLEAPALEIAPVIGEVLAALRAQTGVHIARMSGSGATCFAICDSDAAAEMAAQAIRAAQPAWWVQTARIMT